MPRKSFFKHPCISFVKPSRGTKDLPCHPLLQPPQPAKRVDAYSVVYKELGAKGLPNLYYFRGFVSPFGLFHFPLRASVGLQAATQNAALSEAAQGRSFDYNNGIIMVTLLIINGSLS
jgi:hypothetical protein